MFLARPRQACGLRLLTSCLLAICALGLGGVNAAAQNLFAPVTKVNDDVITGYDVMQRTNLIRFASSRDVPDAERRALELLVEDALKLQEAKRLGLSIDQKRLDEAIAELAQNNRMSVDGLERALQSAGVKRATLEREVRARLLWNQIISQRYGDRLRPTEGEVEAAMEEAQSQAAGPKIYDVRQVVVGVSPSAPLPVVKAAHDEAVKVRGQLKDCSKIAELAPKYSKISGAVGRLSAEQMPGPVRAEVLKLKVNGTTQPLRSGDGFHIIMLCGVDENRAVSRSEVFNRLVDQKGQRFASSYLSELKRGALIESRK